MSSKPPIKIKRQTRKVKVQPKTIEDFYLARGKDIKSYIINEDGDLVSPPVKDGDIEQIFTLPKYRELTVREKIEREELRRENINKAENVVQDLQIKLRDILLSFRKDNAMASEVVLANQEVSKAEKILQELVNPLQFIQVTDKLSVREIILDERYEERKVPYPVYIMKQSPITLQENVSDEPLYEKEKEEEPVIAEPLGAPIIDKTPMTAADRGRLGGIIKIRRKKVA